MSELFQSTIHAAHYASFRPLYPATLIKYVVDQIRCRDGATSSNMLAVDVGCGSGQATRALAPYFQHVVGLDVSPAQIKEALAQQHAPDSPKNISYRIGDSNCLTDVQDSSVACLVAAAAAHWFDLDKFYREAHRVVLPGGVVSMWTYGLMKFIGDDDVLVEEIHEKIHNQFFEVTLKGYWDERLRLALGLYGDLPLLDNGDFEGRRILNSDFDIHGTLSVSQLVGLLRSWSGYVTFCEKNMIDPKSPNDPVVEIENWLHEKLGKDGSVQVVWPVAMILSVRRTQ